jgi:hypothetical protein
MTILFTYARDVTTDRPYFGIVADDTSADYVWPKGADPWFDAQDRLEYLLLPDEEEPEAAADWLALASRNLGAQIETDPPFDDASNLAQAKRLAQRYLDALYDDEDTVPPAGNSSLSGVPDGFDQVAQDYNGFGDSDETLLFNPNATTNAVLMALGPIDPDGPNGWILRAMDGAPAEGDENEYVHFSNTMSPAQTDQPEEASE